MCMRTNETGYALATGIMVMIAVLFSFQASAQQTGAPLVQGAVYRADLVTVNQNITGNAAKGTAEFRVAGDEVAVTINAQGLAPNMMIIAHIHGFPNAKKASCATLSADTNKDGFVDVMESEAVSGPAMVPLNNDPKDFKMKSSSYPKSDKQGLLQYSKKIKLSDLQKGLNKKFGMGTLPLESMVVNLHGVAKQTKLPATVQSEMKLPATQTIPVACGEIKKAK